MVKHGENHRFRTPRQQTDLPGCFGEPNGPGKLTLDAVLEVRTGHARNVAAKRYGSPFPGHMLAI